MLDLRDHPDWGPLDARVAERIGDYRIVEWETFTPEDLVADMARALSTFFSMVPTGDLALEDGEWTPSATWRTSSAWPSAIAASPRRRSPPTATLVGYSDVNVSRAKTTQGSVGITFVLPGHRGHWLGLAVKLANHRALWPRCPSASSSAPATPTSTST